MGSFLKYSLIGCGSLIGLFVLGIAFLIFFGDMIPSNAARALPGSATDIHEYYWDDGFQGDFTRTLKAKMPESDFLEFVNNLDLKDRFDPAIHGNGPVSFTVPCDEEWWNPPTSLDNAFINYKRGDEYFAIAKYHDGHAYFAAFCW